MTDGKESKLLKTLGRYKLAILIAVVGVLLLVWPMDQQADTSAPLPQVGDNTDSLREQEQQMEEKTASFLLCKSSDGLGGIIPLVITSSPVKGVHITSVSESFTPASSSESPACFLL